MKMYLLNDHKAVATDDRSGVIRILPQAEGVLTVAGVSVAVSGDKTPEMALDAVGYVQGLFVTKTGIRYTLINPRMNQNGVPVSQLDERGLMLDMRLKLDKLERAVEKLQKEVSDLRGIYEKDALWFLSEKEDKV